MKYQWTKLSRQQIGRYAEYYTKMELTLFGFDVYTSEVDNKGIDFVAKRNGHYYDFQVKSVRKGSGTYVYMTKKHFVLRPNLWLALMVFSEGEMPSAYIIPSIEWTSPNGLLVSRDYIGKASDPEWGICLSKKNQLILEKYKIESVLNDITS